MSFSGRAWALIAFLLLMGGTLAYVTLRPSRTSGLAIRLGSVLILSGEARSFGEQFKDGALIAKTEVNRDSSQPPIELRFYDSEGSLETVEKRIGEVERDGVRYVADVMGTALAEHVAERWHRAKMLVLSGVNTGPGLTKKGGPYFFRIVPTDVEAARQLVAWGTERGWTRVALVQANDVWAKGLAQEVRAGVERSSGTIAVDVECPKGYDLFAPLVARVQAAAPQAVYLLVYPREAGLFLKDARRQGLQAEFLGTDNFTGNELVEHGGDAAVGARFVVPGDPSAAKSRAQEVLEREFRARHPAEKGDPPLFTRTAYDVVTILSDLARRFGDDTEAAARHLSTAVYEGASGRISFDEDGDLRVGRYGRREFRRADDGSIRAFPSEK